MEYMFLKTYALRYDLEVQVPRWFGCHLFGFNDPPINRKLPQRREEWSNPKNAMCQKIAPKGDEFVNHDFVGYGQYHTSYYRPYRDYIQSLFVPAPEYAERVRPALEQLRAMGQTLVGLHIRRGDYGRMLYHCTPLEWYDDWLQDHWASLPEPIMFISSEEKEAIAHFQQYAPQTTETLGIKLSRDPYPDYDYLPLDLERRDPWQMDFWPDYALLCACQVIVAANSTWSFTAAMLQRDLRGFYRSSLPHRGFLRLDPWDAEPLALEQSEDYASTVPGSRLPNNPYW